MKKIFVLILAIFVSMSVSAQYVYSDTTPAPKIVKAVKGNVGRINVVIPKIPPCPFTVDYRRQFVVCHSPKTENTSLTAQGWVGKTTDDFGSSYDRGVKILHGLQKRAQKNGLTTSEQNSYEATQESHTKSVREKGEKIKLALQAYNASQASFLGIRLSDYLELKPGLESKNVKIQKKAMAQVLKLSYKKDYLTFEN